MRIQSILHGLDESRSCAKGPGEVLPTLRHLRRMYITWVRTAEDDWTLRGVGYVQPVDTHSSTHFSTQDFVGGYLLNFYESRGHSKQSPYKAKKSVAQINLHEFAQIIHISSSYVCPKRLQNLRGVRRVRPTKVRLSVDVADEEGTALLSTIRMFVDT